MKKCLYISSLLCAFCFQSLAQSPSQNYVLGKQLLDGSGTRAITSIIYYDGLGYPVETATNGLNGSGSYAYTLTEYEAPERMVRKWIAGAIGSTSFFITPSELAASLKAYHVDETPYSTNAYDALGRIVSSIGPGQHWHTASKSVNKQYGTNDATSVKQYQMNCSGKLVQDGYFEANTLTSETTINEDGQKIQVFKDLLGKKILERRAGNNDTYYIYDEIDRLRFVLSPSYQEEDDLQKFAYEYQYDNRGRCVWKRLPGCEYQQLWYDNADKLMFSQDGEQRKKGIYLFYLYDFMGRLVLIGTTSSINTSCNSAIATYNTSASGLCNSSYSSNENIGLKDEQLLNASYYDNHAFLNSLIVKQMNLEDITASNVQENNSKGALAGNVERCTNGEYLLKAYYHDIRGNVVKAYISLPGKGLLMQDTEYSFTNKPTTIETTIKQGSLIQNIVQTYSYNKNNDMLESIKLKVGSTEKIIATYTYNGIGKLISVSRSGSAGTIRKKYNIRGWLQAIKTPRFSEDLSYETNAAQPCYAGNISRIQWQTTKDNVLRGYDFYYDDLNRLYSSVYAEGADMNQNINRYSENILDFSANGSIERLQRYGKKNDNTFGMIDDLAYQYNGNQVKSISDKAGSLLYNGSFDFKDGANADTEYFYNANGALSKDLNKGISSIEYDVLGNLQCITFNNGFKTSYIYDASGNKLHTTHESVVTNITDYIGDFILEDGKLSKFQFEGGFCSFDNSLNPTFHYYEKDHLGSIRMVVNEDGTIEQVNHYYPFGGIYGDLSYNNEMQRNKYIGKEFDHTHGLDLYDHGARMYDAARGRWDRMEPLSHKYIFLNPYIYCGNSPISFRDKNGLDWYIENKMYLFSPNVNSAKDLKKGQIYVGKEFNDRKHQVNYRKDGTILFTNEKDAYIRMNKLAKMHSNSYPAGKEESAYLLDNGKVLMMADYKNNSVESKSPGYTLKGNKLSNSQNETFKVVGHVHTHQDLMFDKGMSNRDWNLAVSHPNIPYFIIHADGNIYGGLVRNGKMRSWENFPMADFSEVLTGKLSLFYIVYKLTK